MNKTGVYILKCSNNRYYTGSTNNIGRRLKEHQIGKVRSTKYLRPVDLVFFQKCSGLNEARKLEKKLKNKKSRIIIDQIVRDGVIKNDLSNLRGGSLVG
ncbi:MAG: GIY-YIG nuclease family protein [Patescibacteria group bacterium]